MCIGEDGDIILRGKMMSSKVQIQIQTISKGSNTDKRLRLDEKYNLYRVLNWDTIQVGIGGFPWFTIV